MVNRETPLEVLVGKWFHSIVVRDDGCRIVEWQGEVLGQTADGRYLIQLYSWVDGCPTDQRLVTGPEMQAWCFYDSDKDGKEASRQYNESGSSERHRGHEKIEAAP